MKKKLVLVLVLAIVISAFSINAFAAFTGYTYSENLNERTDAAFWFDQYYNPAPYSFDLPRDNCKRPLRSRGTPESFTTMTQSVHVDYEVWLGVSTVSDPKTVIFYPEPLCNNYLVYGSHEYYTSGIERLYINGIKESENSVWGMWTFEEYWSPRKPW